MGPSVLHGPHHGAQKSTSTGVVSEACSTSLSKFCSVASKTWAEGFTGVPLMADHLCKGCKDSRTWRRGHRDTSITRSGLERLRRQAKTNGSAKPLRCGLRLPSLERPRIRGLGDYATNLRVLLTPRSADFGVGRQQGFYE